MNFHFFAYIYRMRYINRWGLMKNLSPENLAEHAGDCAVMSHALAIIGNRVYGKSIDPNRCMAVALYHDACEIITGDLPTPIKYFNPNILSAYKQIEKNANDSLLSMLPKELRPDYSDLLLCEDEEINHIVHWADKLCAYIKCTEELKSGNKEFKKASSQIKKALESCDLPEMVYFLKNFMPAFQKSLDELD